MGQSTFTTPSPTSIGVVTNLALVNDGVNPLQITHSWDLDEVDLLCHTPQGRSPGSSQSDSCCRYFCTAKATFGVLLCVLHTVCSVCVCVCVCVCARTRVEREREREREREILFAKRLHITYGHGLQVHHTVT